MIACGVHHSSWRWLELSFHVWILLFFGLFCLFFFGGGHDFPINYLLLLMIVWAVFLKELLLECTHWDLDLCSSPSEAVAIITCPETISFLQSVSLSGCITWPVSQLLASYFLFLVQLLLMKYHQNAIAKTCQASVFQFWVTMHLNHF